MMGRREIELLTKARQRERAARKEAEAILEKKSLALYQSNNELGSVNKELKASLAREKELGELKSSFVTTASHQFRTPLSIIQANTELLEMFNSNGKVLEFEKRKRVTNRITKAIGKMSALMDDVLILGQLTSGHISCSPEDLDILSFCEELAKDFNEVQMDKRSLDCKISGEPYQLWLDKRLLSHALSNLISNAFKYSLEKENPQLVMNFKPTELVLSIIDYGIGIPKDQQSNLFHPFFRADNAVSINGTGLGLSIAKEYVEMNKGSIKATSIIGEGSCFEITFKV